MVDHHMKKILFAVLACFLLPVFAGPLDETRYCGEPRRDASGAIYRSSAVRTSFQKAHPCPATGLTNGPCDGWQKDHVIPLASCGCDSVANMQWLPVGIKTCTSVDCKDRWERVVYRCPVAP
jgi:hypothetical protein